MGVYRPKEMQRSHFVFFVRNPNNMGVNRLPWTPKVKIWHFELTQDHLDTDDTKVTSFFSKSIQYGCLRYGLPWTQAIKIWHFELTQDNLDIGDSEG